jgi:hypothetical protein
MLLAPRVWLTAPEMTNSNDHKQHVGLSGRFMLAARRISCGTRFPCDAEPLWRLLEIRYV